MEISSGDLTSLITYPKPLEDEEDSFLDTAVGQNKITIYIYKIYTVFHDISFRNTKVKSLKTPKKQNNMYQNHRQLNNYKLAARSVTDINKKRRSTWQFSGTPWEFQINLSISPQISVKPQISRISRNLRI